MEPLKIFECEWWDGLEWARRKATVYAVTAEAARVFVKEHASIDPTPRYGAGRDAPPVDSWKCQEVGVVQAGIQGDIERVNR